MLKRLKWPDDSISLAQVESLGPGNSVILTLSYPKIAEVLESHGALGISAERVANDAVDQLRRYLDFGAPVGQHLADQLLLPLCLAAGGSFVTGPLTEHFKTNVAVIKQMLNVDISAEEIEPKRQWRIKINGSADKLGKQ